MEEALRNKLLSTAGVVSAVGQRVYWGSRPQGSPLPSVVLTVISGAPLYDDDGEVDLAATRVEMQCWGETYASAKTVSRAIMDSISGFFGTVGTDFQNIMLDTERDFRESGANQAEYLFRTNLDFIVWYRP